MHLYLPNDPLPPIERAILTIGTFDGVHSGHQQIIYHLRQLANQHHAQTVLVTFEPHPRLVVGNHQSPYLLSPDTEKYALLERYGLDHVAVTAFTPAFAQQTPQQYIADFLVRQFQPLGIVVGYDHKFGQHRAGDFALLEQLAPQYGYWVAEIPKHLVDHHTVSSTQIRNALNAGDIATANQLLGYVYPLHGTVVQGQQMGRRLGYPTANLQLVATKQLPEQGVYAVLVQHQQTSYGGMLNIGTRPTVGGTSLSVEVHLLGFEGDLYHQNLSVYLLQRLRPEQKFESLPALVQQLHLDKAQAQALTQPYLTCNNTIPV